MKQLPNALSLGRLLATIPLFVLVLINQPIAYGIALVLFVAASATDWFDGRLARQYKLVSSLGIFLDLTADKVFVSGVLVAMVQVGLVPAWIPLIIITREFIVSGLRTLAAADGKVIPAGQWGKQKTFITLVAMSGILLSRAFDGRTGFPLGLSTSASGPSAIPDYLLALSDVLLVVAVIWTILSAIEYLRDGWGIINKPAASGASGN